MYYLFLASLLLLSPVTKKSETKNITSLFYILLLFFACLRYGMGLDYFTYMHIFYNVPDKLNKYSVLYGVEPGFFFLIVLFKSMGLSFSYFAAFCAFFSLSLFLHTIQRYSLNKTFSLMIFYTNYYLNPIENMLRQGMAMAIFIYALFKYLDDSKIIRYVLLILLGALFHVSIIIALCVPLIVEMNKKWFLNPFNLIIILISAFSISPFGAKILGYFVSHFFPQKAGYFVKFFDYNIFAILLRLFLLVIVLSVLKKTSMKLSRMETLVCKLYVFGVILYLSFSAIKQLSRLTEYFGILEIILLPNLLFRLEKKKRTVYQLLLTCLFIGLFVKDINYNIEAEYKRQNLLAYSYITIFNKQKLKENINNTGYGKYVKSLMNRYAKR